MNRIIDNKICTIIWHIEDPKTSYFDPDVISSVLAEIDMKYGKISKMVITRGKVHKYLDMNIDYSSPGKVILSMIDYVGKMIDNIPEDTNGGSYKLSAHHLFEIVEDATKLSQANADIFHHF